MESKVPTFMELGASGLRESGGQVLEDLVPRLQWPRAGRIYQEMADNDAVITAILFASRQLIRKVNWDVTPASDSPEDLEAAQFLKECMEDMENSWADLIDEITSCFEFGFSYHEVIFKRRLGEKNNPKHASKYNDGRIGWRKIPSRAQTSLYSWEFDSNGNVLGMWQYTIQKSLVYIPLNRSLLFRTTADKNNPEGKSFLRGAYRSWYFKKHIEEIEGIGIERDLAGLPVITAPPGVNIFDDTDEQARIAKNQALNLITSIRRDRNEGVLLPDGWQLQLLSAESSRQFDTNAIINRYDQRIAITMLADIVMLGADKVGSFALAKVKQSLLATALDAQLHSICEVFNQHAIPKLFRFNTFTVKELPRLVANQVVAPDLKELGDYIKALSGANMPIFPDYGLENYLRRVAGLPEIKEEEEEHIQKTVPLLENNSLTGGTKETNTEGETNSE